MCTFDVFRVLGILRWSKADRNNSGYPFLTFTIIQDPRSVIIYCLTFSFRGNVSLHSDSSSSYVPGGILAGIVLYFDYDNVVKTEKPDSCTQIFHWFLI